MIKHYRIEAQADNGEWITICSDQTGYGRIQGRGAIRSARKYLPGNQVVGRKLRAIELTSEELKALGPAAP